MKKVCPQCKAKVIWLPMAPDGRKIPVNEESDPKGALALNEIGWLVKAYETNRELTRYRSHFLDCKASAKALHEVKNIKLPDNIVNRCEYVDCAFQGVHSHVHCFKCGEVGHLARHCESEEVWADRRELRFD